MSASSGTSCSIRARWSCPAHRRDTVLMVRQYRAAVDGELLELPAGKRDVHGEPTEVTAARELAEEIGHGPAGSSCSPASTTRPGFTDELSWLYLARDLTPCHDPQGAEEQHMTIEEVPLAAATGTDRTGEIIDAKSHHRPDPHRQPGSRGLRDADRSVAQFSLG